MNEHLIEIIAIVFGSQGLWVLINNVYQERKKRKKKTPFELMVLALVREKLLFLSKQYIQNGGIPEDEVSAFKELYKSYIEAGGNTNVRELGERANNLPIIFEEN